MPIDKVVEEEVKDKELEASKDYTGLIPEVESPSSRVSMLFVAKKNSYTLVFSTAGALVVVTV